MHPSHILTPEQSALVELWLAWRGDGMGRGHLPFAGGHAEQPAGIMAAFDVMSAAAAKAQARRKPRPRNDAGG